MTSTMTSIALTTPGTALPRETMILLSDLMRLKRRKTRKARSMRSCEKEPRSMPSSDGTDTPTTTKSKRFHDEQRKWGIFSL